MRTAELIERLSAEPPRAFQAGAMLLRTLALGTGISFVLMWAWLGIRPDISAAAGTWAFWIKFAYPLALAAASFWIAGRLAQPGAAAGWAILTAAAPVIVLVALAAWQLTGALPSARPALVMGSSHTVCPWRIIALSLPILVASFFGLRNLAPTRLLAAGAAAGLLAGATGAWVYAFHCDESAMPFVAVWYTLGIAATGFLGAISGKWLLRW